jgi:hypothetical protein
MKHVGRAIGHDLNCRALAAIHCTSDDLTDHEARVCTDKLVEEHLVLLAEHGKLAEELDAVSILLDKTRDDNEPFVRLLRLAEVHIAACTPKRGHILLAEIRAALVGKVTP